MNDLRELETQVAATGLRASVAACLVFWTAELVRPGFVSRFLSVHLFLLSAFAFGAWYASRVERYRDWPLVQYAVAALLVPACAYAAWTLGQGLGDLRLLAAAFAALVPLLILPLARSSS
ncbi:hypothetical protein EPO34_00150 [Patescibacteria group bacterium]|nr:MAG: hypothetical protein EPO34_00150 [Patescibacteria group bacterium]